MTDDPIHPSAEPLVLRDAVWMADRIALAAGAELRAQAARTAANRDPNDAAANTKALRALM